jgi:hypothetical protein
MRGSAGIRGRFTLTGCVMQRVERIVILLSLAFYVGGLLFIHPFATNDGPVHMSFARMFWFGFAGPLQSHLYVLKRELDPNLIGYLIAGPMIPVVGSDWAETILQAVCLVSLPLSGWFVVRALGATNVAWVPVMVAMSLNEMFFLGLYNYSISLSVGILSFGMLIFAESGGMLWWAGFSAVLVVAFLAHAGGLILGMTFAAAWLFPRFVRDTLKGVSLRILTLRYGPPLLATLPALFLMVQFATRHGNSEILHGEGLSYRAKLLLTLNLLATNGTPTVLAAQGVAVLVFGASIAAATARLRRWRIDPASRLDTVRFALLIGSGLALVAAFPDVAGGGSTHVRRMVLLPYIAALILCATHPWTIKLRAAIVICASIFNAVLLGSAVHEQLLAHRQIVAADRLLDRVEDHCTVLPIIPSPSLQTVSPPLPTVSPRYFAVSRTSYTPLSHVATRAEQHGDRVALYNYLARLGVYPISSRPGLDPQQLIFHWAPDYLGGQIETADPASFERVTGITVDYVLVQGDPTGIPPGLRPAVRNYQLVAGSGATGFRLYTRNGTKCGSPGVSAPGG